MITFIHTDTDPLTPGILHILSQSGVQIDNYLLSVEPTRMTRMDAQRRSHTFLFSDPHHPDAAAIVSVRGRKFAFIRHLRPLCDEFLELDGYFVFSAFGLETMSRLHPQLAGKLQLCPIPFDPAAIPQTERTRDCDDTILFVQSFCTESMHLLELYFARMLIDRGYRVVHLFGGESKPNQIHGMEQTLLRAGEAQGIEFVFCSCRANYVKHLSRARLVIALSWHDCVSPLLLAGALGIPVAAPGYGPYPEILPHRCLFSPLNLVEALERVKHPPQPPSPALLCPAKLKDFLSVLSGGDS